jgi:hypothetical protein
MVGLNFKLQKTTVRSTVEQVNIFSYGEDISTVTNCMFVGLITSDSYTNEETKKRISLSKPAMGNLTKIIKVSTKTKVNLLKPTVYPAVLYGWKGKEIKERLMIPCTLRSVNDQALFGNFGHNQQIEIVWTYYAQVRYHEQNMLGLTDGSGK